MSTQPDVVEQVRRLFPIAGPGEPEQVIAAGHALAEVVRFLAHATHGPLGSWHAGDLYALLGALVQTSHGLGQVCAQLAQWCLSLTADPTLRTDALGPAVPPAELAAQAAAQVGLAGEHIRTRVAWALGQAQHATGRLGHDLDGGDQR